MDYREMMDEWSVQTDRVFLSPDHAGEKIKGAAINTPLTIDDIANLAEIGGGLALCGFSAADVLRKHIAVLRAIGILKEE